MSLTAVPMTVCPRHSQAHPASGSCPYCPVVPVSPGAAAVEPLILDPHGFTFAKFYYPMDILSMIPRMVGPRRVQLTFDPFPPGYPQAAHGYIRDSLGNVSVVVPYLGPQGPAKYRLQVPVINIPPGRTGILEFELDLAGEVIVIDSDMRLV